MTFGGAGPSAGVERDVEERYAVLPAQAGFVYNTLSGPVGVDLLQYAVTTVGDRPDRAAWQQAWHRAAARHPVLRTAFDFTRAPAQVVHRSVPLEVESRTATGSFETALDDYALEVRRRPFDPATPPLIRVGLLCGIDRYAHVFTVHHAVLDGRSVQTLHTEVFADYDAIRAGTTAEFAARPAYRDFVSWWDTRDPAADRAFWSPELHEYRPAPLSGVVEPGEAELPEPTTRELTLDEAVSARLRAAAESAGVTLPTLVNAAWALLLSRYQGIDDVLFATTRSCRYGSVEGADAMLGMMLNTVLLRIPVDRATRTGDFLAEVGRRVRAVRDHQLAGLGDVQRWTGLTADDLPDTLVLFERRVMQSALAAADPRFAGRRVTVYRQPSFPVTAYVFDEPGLLIQLSYDRQRLAAVAADRLARLVPLALTGLAGDPAMPLGDITLDDARPPTGIARRDRSAYRAVDPGGPASSIARRDRSAYRAPASGVPSRGELPEHLVPLGETPWAVWRWVCLRGAGFPFALHETLASPTLAATADAVAAAPDDPTLASAYDAEFATAERALSRAVHAVAGQSRFREAVAWQNRHALRTGLDAIRRRDPETVTRTGRYRKYEALVSGYLQRYCGKNDTIGFYGPLGWASFVDGSDPIDLRPAPPGQLARRAAYFETWAVQAVADRFGDELGRWLVPRRMPLIDLSSTVDDGRLLVPCAPSVPVDRIAAAAFRHIDGARNAEEVAAAVRADLAVGVDAGGGAGAAPDDGVVFAALAALRRANLITWRLDVPPDDIHPERTLRARLAAMPDDRRTTPALAALDELGAARDAAANASTAPDTSTVDSSGPAAALEALEETFVRLTGAQATRRAGENYAGRTLVYQECLRADDVTFGPALLDPLSRPLELVLESARWYTAAGAAMFHRLCLDVYRDRARVTGSATVPFAEFWLDANDLIFRAPEHLSGPLARALQARWAPILALPEGARRVTLDSAALRDRVRAAFAAQPGWPGAVQHSPDLMIAAADPVKVRTGDVDWVLGELHPGMNTMRYASWVAYHPAPDRLGVARRADLGRPVVTAAATAATGGAPVQPSPVFAAPDDTRLVYAQDSNGYDPDRALFVGECELSEVDDRLRVRRRRDGTTYDLIDVVAEPLAQSLIQHFRIVPGSAHTPRVTIDRLVIQREAWTFLAGELAFAHIADEARRFVAVRRWRAGADLPRYVFVRTEGELKPIFVDLAGLASVDLMCRAVRRAVREVGDTARVGVTEMLPTPEQLWLVDRDGHRYTSELRVCAVDRGLRARGGKG